MQFPNLITRQESELNNKHLLLGIFRLHRRSCVMSYGHLGSNYIKVEFSFV